MLAELYFATGNRDKIKEVEAILGLPIKIFVAELDEIQSLSLEEIATKKANEAFRKLGKPLLVEDAGLFIDAWNGFPGPFVKHLVAAGGNKLILRMLRNESSRGAWARAIFGFHDGQKILTFVGEVEGKISTEEEGSGWGWDPIFIPKGSQETYGQMGPEQKNLISHRKVALEKLKEFLKSS